MKLITAYKNATDAELVLLLKEGDDIACSEIFMRYRGMLLLFAFRRLQDVEQAKDLINDVFSDIWENKTELKVNDALRSYLFTAVRNKIFNNYKHKKVSEKHLDDLKYSMETEEDNTDFLIRHKEMSAQIEREIEALPEKMKQVFILSRKEFMSRKEVSKHLNLPEGNIKTNLHRAIEILKIRLRGSNL